MTIPPRLATWLLTQTLGPAERDGVVGDLHEEFTCYIVPARGARLARWWYRSQVARSLAPLVTRMWERASLRRATTAVTAAALITTGPAVSLVALRSFVLQQVPLKTTAEMSLPFALLLALVALFGIAAGVSIAILILSSDTVER